MGLLFSQCPAAGCAEPPFPSSLVVRKAGKVRVDFRRLLDHALRSWAVYHTVSEIESGEFYPPIDAFGNLSESRQCLHLDNFGMFLERLKDGVQWVSIRGTQKLANIKDNLQYDLEFAPELQIRAHRGFIALCRKAWQELKPRLDKRHPVRVTGHSLGGAVASLLGVRLMNEGFRVQEIVSFGAPKFTDFDGCVLFLRQHVPLLRVNNNGDPVPTLPPWKQYIHAGAEVRLHGQDPVLFDWMSGSDASISHQDASLQFWARLTTLPNHLLVDYIRNIIPKLSQRDLTLEAALGRA